MTPERFSVTYVVAALRRACPELALGAEDALRSPDVDPMRDVVPSLLNELAEVDEPLLLVLDDYHVISREDIHSSVGYVIDHLPRGCSWPSPPERIPGCASGASGHQAM